MTVVSTDQTAFSAGELDPTLRAQHSLTAYRDGATRVRDMMRRNTGGLERRFGTYDLANTVTNARLAEFEFSSTQRYVIALRDSTADIYDLNGTLLQSIATAPWGLTEAFELTYSQLGDTMMLSHQSFPTQVLKRTGPTSFTLSDFAFDVSIDGHKVYQPYYKFAPATCSITPSASSGAITVTASTAIFTAARVGERIRIYDCEILLTGYTSPTVMSGTVSGTLVGKLDLDPFKTTIGSTTVEVLHFFHGLVTGASITLSGSNSVGGIAGSALVGTFVVTVIDELRYTITAGAIAATSSDDGGGTNVQFQCGGTATRSFLEQSISPLRGYPGACAFHEQRLWFGGTPAQPDAVFGSKSTFPFNFDVGKGYDGDSVQGATGSEDVSTVLHLVSNGELFVMTATRESVYVTPYGDAITPNNQRIKGQSSAGTGLVQPIIFDAAVLFVQENGLSVSELGLASNGGSFVATNVSTLAGHLIRQPVSAAASKGTLTRAEEFAFFVNSGTNDKEDVAEGSVAVFHSLRQENVAGWSLWTLGAGKVRSVAAIGSYVFFVVEVRGGFRLYRLAGEDLLQLDGAVHHVNGGVAKQDWVLDARVRGRTVSIVSELGYHGDYVVPAGGAVHLSVPVTDLVAGDPFYFVLETLTPEVAWVQGSRAGMIKRVFRSIIEFDECYAATVDGERIETRLSGEDPAGPITPLDGPYEVGHLGYDRAPRTVISQTEPLRGRVLGINQKVKI